jgi:hypothetical protein
MGYIDFEYKGSVGYNSVMSCTKSQLRYRMGYTEGAIAFHTKEGNEGQVKFFKDELNLINRRLKLKSVRE